MSIPPITWRHHRGPRDRLRGTSLVYTHHEVVCPFAQNRHRPPLCIYTICQYRCSVLFILLRQVIISPNTSVTPDEVPVHYFPRASVAMKLYLSTHTAIPDRPDAVENCAAGLQKRTCVSRRQSCSPFMRPATAHGVAVLTPRGRGPPHRRRMGRGRARTHPRD